MWQKLQSEQSMKSMNNLRGGIKKFGPLLVFFVGMHSIVLGIVIYFFTDFFYQQFFSAAVENIFFVRQSGVFLFLAGFFYLYPLIDLKKYYNILLLVVFSKFVAVYFLVANAGFTLAPAMIYLAAFFDCLMGLAIMAIYRDLRKTFGGIEEKRFEEGALYQDGMN